MVLKVNIPNVFRSFRSWGLTKFEADIEESLHGWVIGWSGEKEL